MFVINFKLNLKKIFIVLLIIAALIAIIIEFGFSNNASISSSKAIDKYDYILEESNYTEILKMVHDNIDANVNKTVKMVGYVFKMADFKEDYFVCGRNTLVNGEDNIAGFLCQSKEASKLTENEWVEITGVIIKGFYNQDMPVVKVGSIKKIAAPANTYVETKKQ
ncbi:MAG: hypothetical protein N2749_01410 [Clostridia bacterium]|nr:hypothetical protein [Clostridia bacterium]